MSQSSDSSVRLHPSSVGFNSSMRKHIGFTLQFLVLFVFLPMIVLWQLAFSFRLILMPALLIVGILLFWIGHKLREG